MIHGKGKLQSGLVTLKAGVLVRYRGRVLLIRERNNRTRRYAWNIIKGTFEHTKDESILATAVREAREEANAIVKLRYLIGTYYLLDTGRALLMFAFIADLMDPRVAIAPKKLQMKYRLGEDIVEIRFFTKAQLSILRPKDFIGMRGYLVVRDYLAGRRFSLSAIHTLPPK